MSLTTKEKIELVATRYDPDELCELLEITPGELLEAFNMELEEMWYKFKDIESDLNNY